MASCSEGDRGKKAPGPAAADVGIDIHWHGHDAFRIVDAGKEIYIDPYKLPDGLPQADYIFITHAHRDHFSPDDVEKVRTPATKIVATADVAAKVGEGSIVIAPGNEIEVDALKVKAIPAYNVTKFRSPGVPFHPKESGWVGYIITLADGTTLYHAGDTDFIPEMKSVTVDVALIPVSGTYVMTAQEAVEAANAMKPGVAIPMHYGAGVVGTAEDAEKFREGYAGKTAILQKE
jgi:L-ascorbate metabolism protein UlaG (beta-lactamase superfamily)